MEKFQCPVSHCISRKIIRPISMKYPILSQLQQVHVGTPNGHTPVSSYQGDANIYSQEHETLQNSLLRMCPADVWPKDSHNASCPRPILITNQHQQRLVQFHTSLNAAIVDILGRWWTDADAKFPERMSLGIEEEKLLRVRTRRWSCIEKSTSLADFCIFTH